MPDQAAHRRRPVDRALLVPRRPVCHARSMASLCTLYAGPRSAPRWHTTPIDAPVQHRRPDRSFGSAVRRLREQARDRLARRRSDHRVGMGCRRRRRCARSARGDIGGVPARIRRRGGGGRRGAVLVLRAGHGRQPDGADPQRWHSARQLPRVAHARSQLGDHTLPSRRCHDADDRAAGLCSGAERPPARGVERRRAAHRLPWSGGPAGLGVDALGRPVALQDGPTPAVAIGPAPIYLDLALSDVDLDARLAAAA